MGTRDILLSDRNEARHMLKSSSPKKISDTGSTLSHVYSGGPEIEELESRESPQTLKKKLKYARKILTQLRCLRQSGVPENSVDLKLEFVSPSAFWAGNFKPVMSFGPVQHPLANTAFIPNFWSICDYSEDEGKVARMLEDYWREMRESF
jgi:hypothetical protein